MFDILTESFLFEYFLYSSLLGKYFCSKDIFHCLKEIFCIKDMEDLYETIESEIVKDIKTEEDYKRYRRIKQYNELIEVPKLFEEKEEILISLKGKAMNTANQYALFASNEMTKTLIERNIHNYAKQGSIIAMRVLGTLECAGIFVEKNKKSGLKYLEKATQWGDTFAALSLLKFDEGHRKSTLEKLNASIFETPYAFLSCQLQKEYNIKTTKDNKEILLLKKTFASGKLKQDVYEPLYARLIFGSTLSIKDKEKIVFSENKEIISEACDLPLKFKEDDISVDESVLMTMPIIRLEEQHNLLVGLRNSDLRTIKTYKPLGVYSDSLYALDIYTKSIIKMLDQNHIEKIEVSDLRGTDFEPTKNHTFIRYAEEGKNNIYLLILKGEIEDSILENIMNFLKSDKRERFYLNHPAVNLNLSQILPICICDKENASKLKNFVEFIKVANINSNEKTNVIKAMLEEKSKSYLLPSTTIEEPALKELDALSLESIDKVLDKVLKEYRVKNEKIHLTVEMLKPFVEDKKKATQKTTYGFGGIIYENN
ncbi:MAG: hypothetical protein NC310_01190 [Roseburia sp.]|nr:hypothetical protein [Anaeroplasma bactoclasticum]MCM1195668.1 hypothetical protein [Roseburia sp.]